MIQTWRLRLHNRGEVFVSEFIQFIQSLNLQSLSFKRGKLRSVRIILVLSFLLASCNGSDKNSDPTSAPTATGPEDAVFGTSYDLAIVCNEAGEVVSITGKGLDPNPQTHTCTASGPEDFSLSLKQEVSFPSPNDLTISSKDQDENPTDKTTTVDVPINTLPWRVYIDGKSLQEISASNAQSFTVEGSCTEEEQPVIVSVRWD